MKDEQNMKAIKVSFFEKINIKGKSNIWWVDLFLE